MAVFSIQEGCVNPGDTLSSVDIKSVQSSTMEKVFERNLENSGCQVKSPNYVPLPVSVSLQSTCQDAGSLDTMFTCLPSISSPTTLSPEGEAGTSNFFSLHCPDLPCCQHWQIPRFIFLTSYLTHLYWRSEPLIHSLHHDLWPSDLSHHPWLRDHHRHLQGSHRPGPQHCGWLWHPTGKGQTMNMVNLGMGHSFSQV